MNTSISFIFPISHNNIKFIENGIQSGTGKPTTATATATISTYKENKSKTNHQ